MNMFPLAVNLNPDAGKPKYQVTIEQVKNGWYVEVQVILNEPPPLTQEEAQRKIGLLMKAAQERAAQGGDIVLDKVLDNAQDEEKQKKNDILGPRVFVTLKELLAFLTFVYEEDPAAELKSDDGGKDGKTGKGKKK